MRFNSTELNKIKLLCLLVLILPTRPCGNGCLTCDFNSKCSLCDVFNGFKLFDSACERVTNLENCQLMDQQGDCAYCESGYYLDSATRRCVVVPEIGVIEKCFAYNPDQTCGLCETGMVTQNGICLTAETPIPNCLHQLDQLFCINCDKGYVLAIDRRTCVETDKADSNCGSYSLVECMTCKKDHLLDKNKYLLDVRELIKGDGSIESLLTGFVKEMEGDVNRAFGGVCKGVSVSNCAVFNGYNECKSCMPNHFKTDDHDCKPYPSDVIANCFVYISLTNCQQCNNGYYIGPENDCKPVEDIDDCAEYDAFAKKSECTKCLDEFYLVSTEKCTKRLNEDILECLDFTPDEDNCMNCNEGFLITNDKLACKEKIEHCIKYDISSAADEKLKCVQCGDGYYVSEDKCTNGSVENCKTFKVSTDDCEVCDFKHYLQSARACAGHKEIKECEVYSQTEQDKCNNCTNKFIGFNITNRCAPANLIPGCTSYINETDCATCSEGYLKNQTSCDALSAEMNCVVATDADTCTTCKANYIIHKDKCKIGPGFVIKDCDDANIEDGKQSFESSKCEQCSNGTVAWNFKDQYICYEKTWVDLLSNNPIENCVQMSINTGTETATCTRCADTHYLESGACLEACTEDYIITHTLVNAAGGKKNITSGRECKSAAFTGKITNCEVYSYGNSASAANSTPICVKCKEGYGKVIDITSSFSTPLQGGATLADITWNVESPIAFFPAPTECVDIKNDSTKTIHFSQPEEHKIEGCEYYAADSTDYYCIKCETGKSGLIKNHANGDFIEQCVTIQCSASFSYGLDVKQNSLISCFKCTQSDYIPFLFIKGGAAYTDIGAFKAYDLEAAAKNYDLPTDGGHTMGCHNKDGSDFNIVDYVLPNNCAIGGFNVETSTANGGSGKTSPITNTNNLATFCLACEGGYRRKKILLDNSSVVPQAVYECEQIANCSNTSWLNHCGLCSDKYAFKYETATGVDYTECLSFEKDPNCFAANAAITGDCMICKSGYQKNKDDLCEKIVAPDCLENKFFPRRPMANIDFGSLLYINQNGAGCLECKSSFIAVLAEVNTPICVASEYVEKVNTLDTTNYIKNCIGYYLEVNELKCKRCKTGYVLANNGIQCFVLDQLASCQLASTEKECEKCSEGYIPIAHKCRKKEIVNCKSFNTTPSQETQTCIGCDDGFYLESNKCKEGSIDSCIAYTSGGSKCSQCKEGYQKIDAGGNDYCFKLSEDTNCTSFDESRFQNNELLCKTCSSLDPLYIETEMGESPTYTCLPITEKEQCEEYHNKFLIRDSTMMCAKCKKDFYVDKNGNCVERLNKTDGCETFSNTSDKCLKCNFGYFINTEEGTCTANPIGIANCRIYLNDDTCLACKDNTYLNANECKPVPEANQIENCIYYADLETCKGCEANFLLANNVCTQATAKDCLSLKSLTECATCPEKKGLKTEQELTNCVANPDNFCLEFVQVYPFVCSKCKSGYYPGDNGTCAKAIANISRCTVYLNASQCKSCNTGYVLSKEKTKCSNTTEVKEFIEASCGDLVTLTTPYCIMCKGGSMFGEEATCKSVCPAGCFFCDPDNVEKCFVCNSGMSMDKEGSCKDMNNPTGPPVEESVSVVRCLVVVLLAFIWIN